MSMVNAIGQIQYTLTSLLKYRNSAGSKNAKPHASHRSPPLATPFGELARHLFPSMPVVNPHESREEQPLCLGEEDVCLCVRTAPEVGEQPWVVDLAPSRAALCWRMGGYVD